jgi:presequence protease
MIKVDPANPEIQADALLHGFRVTQKQSLPNLCAYYYELIHEKTGAKHAHVSHEMDENAFVLSFSTIPENSTGVSHIIEHSVLEGSKRYPVKMFNLLKGRSLNSFVNAMTGADRTSYPFASCNQDDYFNLLDRYLDACYFPLLERESFLQEGWRLEFEQSNNPQSQLLIRGVVYNEMRATMTNPDTIFARKLRAKLYPDLCYRHISGGDPQSIPDLSETEWRNFHKKFYHPSNSWTYTFGSFPLEKILQRINSVIDCFDSTESYSPGIQANISPAQRHQLSYPAGPDNANSPESPAIAALSWRLGPTTDFDLSIALNLLIRSIAGGLTAPLNAALLQSKLAPALASLGLDGSCSSYNFSAGLKGIKAESLSSMEELILETLHSLSVNGIDPKLVTATLDRYEFEIRDQNRSYGFPWGLSLGYFGMQGWMKGGDLYRSLRSDLLLKQLRSMLKQPGFLENVIRDQFLENDQRVLLMMEPEYGGLQRIDAEQRKHLSLVSKNFDFEKKQKIIDQTDKVRVYREREDDLSYMPELDPASFSRDIRKYSGAFRKVGDTKIWTDDQPVNGIAHMRFDYKLDTAAVDFALVDLLGLVPRLALGGLSLAESERRLNSATGGIEFGSFHTLMSSGESSGHWLRLGFQFLCSRKDEAFDIVKKLIYEADFNDSERLNDLIEMSQANLNSRIVSGARGIAMEAASNAVSVIGNEMNICEGIPFLRSVHKLNSRRDHLGQRLSNLLAGILSTSASACLVAENEYHERLLDCYLDFKNTSHKLSHYSGDNSPPAKTSNWETGKLKAWTTDVDGAYVAQSFPAPDLASEDAPLLNLLGLILYKPLQERIRAAGGAYGASAVYNWSSKTFSFLSWRDPRISGTLNDFQLSLEQILKGEFNATDLQEAKVEAIRRMDAPLLPAEKGLKGYYMNLVGSQEKNRKEFRRILLDATQDDLQTVSQRWLADETKSAKVVVCSESQLTGNEIGGLKVDVEPILN